MKLPGHTRTPLAGPTRGLSLAAPVALFLSLAACSTLPEQAAQPTLAPRALAASFTASGRVAARVVGDAQRGFSGGFVWAHTPSGDTIELLTPLGQTAARMALTAAGAEIELPDGRRTFTSDPEQFLSDAMGAALPVAALPNWMQAVPLAQVPFRAEVDAIGRPATLWQNGWQIRYTTYADESAGAHPTRMQLTQGDIDARMIISDWSPN